MAIWPALRWLRSSIDLVAKPIACASILRRVREPDLTLQRLFLGGLEPSVVSATPGRKLSLGVFKMPLRRCLSELAR